MNYATGDRRRKAFLRWVNVIKTEKRETGIYYRQLQLRRSWSQWRLGMALRMEHRRRQRVEEILNRRKSTAMPNTVKTISSIEQRAAYDLVLREEHRDAARVHDIENGAGATELLQKAVEFNKQRQARRGLRGWVGLIALEFGQR